MGKKRSSSNYRVVDLHKEERKKIKRKELRKIYLLIFMLICITVGASYAFLTMTITSNNELSIKSGIFNIEFKDGNEINLDNIGPVSDDEGLRGTPYTFSVENIGNVDGKYTISLEEKSGNNLDKSYVKYAIQKNDGEYSTPRKLTDDLILVENSELLKTNKDTYNLKLWVDYDAPNEVQGKEFSAKLVVKSVQNTEIIASDKIFITLNGALAQTVLKNSQYSDPGVLSLEENEENKNPGLVDKAYEYFDGEDIESVENIDTSKVGVYYIHYTYKSAHNVRVVNVVEENSVEAQITLKGDSQVNVKKNTEYVDSGYDSADRVVVLGEVNTNKVGTYILKYVAISETGSMASVTRVVNVIEKGAITITNTANTSQRQVTININITTTDGNLEYYYFTDSNKNPEEVDYQKLKTPTNNYTKEEKVNKNGTYYVWAIDSNKNIKSKEITVSGIDNTKPVCSFSNLSSIGLNYEREIELSCTDQNGIVSTYLTDNNFSINNSNIEIVDISAPVAITNGYKYTITLRGKSIGTSIVKLLNRSIKDINDNYNNETQTTELEVIKQDNTVTYDYLENGGTSSTKESDEFSNGEEVDLTPTATKDGYTFVGWNTNKDATTGLSSLTMEDDDIVLYAIYRKEAITYTVTYTKGANVTGIGKTGDSCTIPAVYNKATQETTCNVTLPSITPADGYSVRGWDDGEEIYSPSSSYILSSNNVTLTAKASINSYTATFNGNGGSNGTSITTSYGSALGTLPTSSRSGYTFEGWYTEETGGSKISASTTMPVGGAEYFAHWTPVTYTISYNLNGGSGTNPTSYTIESNAITLNNPTKDGYTFAGWTGSNGDEPQTTVTIAKGSTGNKTYTANWTDTTKPTCSWSNLPTLQTNTTGNANLTCTDAQSGVVSKALATTDFTTTANGTVTAVSEPTAVTNGYRYTVTLKGLSVGTFTTSLKAGSISDNATNTNNVAISSNVTVNGLTYTATFVAGNNASFTGATGKSCTTTGSATSCSITLPTITPASGYSEDGWYNGTTKAGNSGESYTLTSDVELTTKANINSYTATFDGNGGTNGTSITKNYGSALGTLPTSTRTGYTFEGWYTEETGGSKISASTTMPVGGATYYAHWLTNVEIPTTASHCAGVTYNGDSQTITNAAATGYSFSGNTGKVNADSYTVTASISSGYAWSDGSTSNKTFTCSIAKRSTTCTSGSTSKTYDGTALTSTNTGSCTNIVDGQTTTFSGHTGTITNAGSTENTFGSVVIKSGTTDVSGNYTITKENGTLTVNQAKTATTGSCVSPTYDGTSKTLASGGNHVSYSNNTRTNAGSQEVTITTDNNHQFSDGDESKTMSCSVAQRATTCTSGSASKTYDGTALTSTNTGSCTNLVTGHSATLTGHTGTITNAGSTANTFGNVVINSETTNVSSNYAITKANGTLTVNKANISPTVNMSGYTFAGTKSTPSVSGNTGNASVTYYYNTTNSNSGGTAWTTVTDSSSLAVGTYYMYAVVGASTNYNGATTPTKSFTVSGITRTATFTAGANAAYVGSNQLSCTTTGTNTSCSITLPSITPASGYSEDGWYNGTTKAGNSGESYTLTSDVELTTKANINSYTATFNGNGGTNGTSITKNYGSALGTLPTSTRTGYTFEGWYTEETGGSKISASTTMPLNGATYYAHWLTNVEIPTTASHCAGVTYNGSGQTITNAAATGYSFSGNTGKVNADSYTVTASLSSGYAWSDGSTSNKTFTCSIAKRTTTCTSGSTSKTYDGTALTSTNTGSCTNIVDGQTTTFSGHTGTITNAGSTANTFGSVVIKSGTTDVSSNYSITKANGTLTVNQAKTATTGSCGSNTYDSTSKTLASGGSYVSYSNNTRTAAGSQDVTVTTDNNHQFSDGSESTTMSCSVAQRATTCTSGSASKTYDGTALTSTNTGSCTNIVDGQTTTFSGHTGTITNAGTAANTFGSVIIKSGTTDVSANYNITKANGTLTVNKANITPTVNMSGYTYGATSIPSVSGNAGNASVTYYYNTTNSNSGGTQWSGSVDIGVGTYYMYAVVGASTNYNGATTPTKSFTVSGITRIATFTAGANAAYVGSNQLSCTTTGKNTSCSITLPTITPASGYSEDGWYLGSEKVGNSGDSYTLTSNVELTTKANINSYTATFNGNGGTNGTSITKSYGSALGTLPTSTRTGYTFEGWYTEETGGSKISSTTTMPLNGATYYAHWVDDIPPSNVTLTNSSGGNWTNQTVTVTVSATDTGSGIAKFQAKYSETNNEWSDTAATVINGSINSEWIAERNETAYYRAVDAAGNVSEPVSTNIKIDKTKPSCSWSGLPTLQTNDTGTATLTCADGASGVVSKNLSTTDFTTTANGTVTAVSAPTAVTNGYKYTVTLKGLSRGTFTASLKAGSISDNATNTNNEAASSNITVYELYTATFNGNGGTDGTSITKDYGAQLGTLPTSTRTGYTFEGWYTEETGGSKISSTTTMPLNGATYYAHWVDDIPPSNVTLTNSSGGNWTNQIVTVTVSATDAGSGIAKFQGKYSGTNNEWSDTAATVINGSINSGWSAERNETVYYRAVDAAGNVSEPVSTNIKIDKTKPSCSWSGLPTLQTNGTGTATLTCADGASGVVSKNLSTTDFTTTENGTVTAVSAPTAVTNGYKYTVTLKGLSVGTFTASLKAETISDNATNTNNAATSSNITVNGLTYTATFNANGNTLSTPSGCSASGSNRVCSCTTTGTNTSCNITTPTISNTVTPTVVGYSSSSAGTTTAEYGSNATVSLNGSNSGTTKYAQTYNPDVTYSITYTKDANVTTIGSTGDSCTIGKTYNGTAQPTSCIKTYTLPAITVNTKTTTALGWYNSSSTLMGAAGSQVSITLTKDSTLTAKAKTAYMQSSSLDADRCFTITTYDVPSHVTNVQYPVWTAANGQDDIKWYSATKSGTTWSKKICQSDHNNETSSYAVHVYFTNPTDGQYYVLGKEYAFFSPYIKEIYRYNENGSGSGTSFTGCLGGEEAGCSNVKSTMDHLSTFNTGDIVKYEVKSGVEKYFNVLYDKGDTLIMQQRENTIYSTAWYAGSNDSTKGPTTVLSAIENATSSWTNVKNQTYTLGTTAFGTESFETNHTACALTAGATPNASLCNGDSYSSLTRTNVKARIITAQEAGEMGCKIYKSDGSANMTCKKFMNNYLYKSTTYGGTIVDDYHTAGAHNEGYSTLSSQLYNLGGNLTVYATGAVANTATSSLNYGARAVVVVSKR